MLKKLFDIFRPTRIDDPFFGRLLYMKATRGKLSYWEGARSFEPLGKIAEVFVDTLSETDGPNDAQRDYFRWVESNYASICAIVDGCFRAHSWAGQLMKGRFVEEFSLGSFSIPLCREAAEEWFISFDSASDPDHLFSVTLRGLEARDVSVDG